MENENKAPRQKSIEELTGDINAMDSYKQEQLEVVERGNAAKAEIVKRLGHELNLKAGNDLLVSKRGLETINIALRQQNDPQRDVVLLAIVIDNAFAEDASQRLDEEKVVLLVYSALQDQLPHGTRTSATSLKKTHKSLVKNFSDVFTRLTNAISQDNKTTAGTIQNEYKHSFAFNPQKYVPEES
jgi:hypothetical protein